MPRRPFYSGVHTSGSSLTVLVDEEECLYVLRGDFSEFGIKFVEKNFRYHENPMCVIEIDFVALPK
jgi:hypothetical protein